LDFWPKFWFLTKISIFDQSFVFWPKFWFLTKISIFDQSFVFLLKFRFFANYIKAWLPLGGAQFGMCWNPIWAELQCALIQCFIFNPSDFNPPPVLFYVKKEMVFFFTFFSFIQLLYKFFFENGIFCTGVA